MLLSYAKRQHLVNGKRECCPSPEHCARSAPLSTIYIRRSVRFRASLGGPKLPRSYHAYSPLCSMDEILDATRKFNYCDSISIWKKKSPRPGLRCPDSVTISHDAECMYIQGGVAVCLFLSSSTTAARVDSSPRATSAIYLRALAGGE